MPSPAAPTSAVSDPADQPTGGHLMRSPERWIAVLRIGVGLWFLKSLWTKIGVGWAGPLPVPAATERWAGFMPVRVGEWAASHPSAGYRSFLEQVVLPNAELFATLTAFGETAVGIGLVLGLLTGWAAFGGLFLMLNYTFASLGTGLNQQGFHLLLILCFAAFLGARAGRRWGVDRLLLDRARDAVRRILLL